MAPRFLSGFLELFLGENLLILLPRRYDEQRVVYGLDPEHAMVCPVWAKKKVVNLVPEVEAEELPVIKAGSYRIRSRIGSFLGIKPASYYEYLVESSPEIVWMRAKDVYNVLMRNLDDTLIYLGRQVPAKQVWSGLVIRTGLINKIRRFYVVTKRRVLADCGCPKTLCVRYVAVLHRAVVMLT